MDMTNRHAGPFYFAEDVLVPAPTVPHIQRPQLLPSRGPRNKSGVTKVVAAALLAATALPVAAQQPEPHWVASWGAAQQIPEPQNSLPAADLTDATLREIVHLSIGGPKV